MAPLKTITASSLSAEIAPWVLSNRVPLSALFELTYRCNFDCVHCYVVQPHTRGELSTDEVLDALAQLRELGTLFLTLTGGEILTRPDFEDIYLEAKRLGFLITLFTNGALIKDRTLDLLSRYPPKKVEVTLYGAEERSYQQVTRRQGMRRLVLANVDRLLDLGVRVTLKSVALSLNYQELQAIRDEARARGSDEAFRFDSVITARIDCRRGPTDYRIPVAEVVATDAQDAKRVEDLRRMYERSRDLGPPNKKLFKCGAGRASLVIDPYGKVQTCVLYRKEGGDLRRQPLREIWERTIPGIVDQDARRTTRCRTCDKLAICGSCTGTNTLESGGDPHEPSDYLCEVAHARVDAFCGDLQPRVGPPAGRWLPLFKAQECQRPWLHERRPLPRWASSLAPMRSAPRPLPVVAR